MQKVLMKPLHEKEIGNFIVYQNTKLGEGQYGKVYLAKQKDCAGFLACKMISKDRLSRIKKGNEYLKNECTIMKQIKSEHVLKLYDTKETDSHHLLFLQFCNGGDLENLLEIRGTFLEQEGRFFVSQIA